MSAQTAKTTKHRPKWRKNGLLLALGILLSIVYVFPFYIIVLNSFKTQREFFENVLAMPTALFTENYMRAFDALRYFQTIGNNLYITTGSLAGIVLFGSMAAWRITRTFEKKGIKLIYYVMIAGMLIPFMGIMLPFISWIDTLGLMSKSGMWVIYTGFGSSMAMFLMSGFVHSIPKEIEEAAIIDGCNNFTLFFDIVMALLKPIILTVIFLNLIWIWNDYLMPSLILRQPGNQTLPLMIFQFFGGQVRRWNLALAGLTLSIAPVILFYILMQKHIIKGISDGAVKS